MARFDSGIMARARYWRDADMRTRFRELMAQARHAEKLGGVSFVKGRRSSSDPFYEIPRMPLLCRGAAEAPCVRLVTGIDLLALRKPLNVADDGAHPNVRNDR